MTTSPVSVLVPICTSASCLHKIVKIYTVTVVYCYLLIHVFCTVECQEVMLQVANMISTGSTAPLLHEALSLLS